ncbi:MAG: SMP-30/gluconolactonase/LRE family protein, partial [Myxococcota bacterium]
VLYRECEGHPLRGPNDIVFDQTGGFWFTDIGKTHGRVKHEGGLYYARTDGSQIREAVFSLDSANGVGLSPDENTVYVADSGSARLWGFSLAGPGEIKGRAATSQRNFVAGLAGHQFFDSLAVDSAGHICVATISNGGITRISPDGGEIAHVPTDDVMTTNICFGGEKLGTAYITLSSSGRLVATEWAVPGLPQNFLNT